MLELLRISNFAIIDSIEIEFCPELTVITGETGAGKSIVLGALRMLLGERAASDVVRAGSKRSSIEGMFSAVTPEVCRWTKANDFDADDGGNGTTVLVRREIPTEGNSRNYINGKAATVGQLRELGNLLVDMHSQDDHTSLYVAGTQLRLLDNFGAYVKEMAAYKVAFEKWRTARERFDHLSSARGDGEKRRDFLHFQINEIEEAELLIGEDKELEEERKRLSNAEKIQEVCAGIRELLFEGERNDNPAGIQVGQAIKLLQELVHMDSSQEMLVKDAETIRFALEDLWEKVRDYSDRIEGNPERLDFVENRLETLRTLKRKYGGTLEEVIALGEKLRGELNDIENYDEAFSRAAQELDSAEGETLQAGLGLRQARTKAGRKFDKQVVEVMHDLELPKARLEVVLTGGDNQGSVEGRPVFSPAGLDSCEFMVSLNAGEALKPLRKVASGGEVSRIMLAIKSVLADKDGISTLIFDEIDTGISGQAASRVGEKLKVLSDVYQVICITHLPQVAAKGSRHLVIEKKAEGERTVTNVREVSGEARTMALARMLSGEKIDDTSRKFAEKLLVQ